MLAAGMSEPEHRLPAVVTLDTAGKHVSHVLGKLGAASRTEAVARARQRASFLARSLPALATGVARGRARWCQPPPRKIPPHVHFRLMPARGPLIACRRKTRRSGGGMRMTVLAPPLRQTPAGGAGWPGADRLRGDRRAAGPRSLGPLGAGGAALWASTTQRTAATSTWAPGVTAAPVTPSSAARRTCTGYGRAARPWSPLGTVQIHITPARGVGPAFAGIAPANAVGRDLAPVATTRSATSPATTPPTPATPAALPRPRPPGPGIGAAQAAGPGTQTLTWPDRSGSWTVAAMTPTGQGRSPCASALQRRRPLCLDRRRLLSGGSSSWPPP